MKLIKSPNFLAWNRNKRSIALNLKSRKVHELIMKMAAKADVVVQNFRPGVLAKLGYGYEDFKAVNPRIIYCSGSGYGEEGPYVDRPGQDMLIQGLAGLISTPGRGDAAPVPAGAGLADQIGAMNMVYGILSALYYRERTGKGQKIDCKIVQGIDSEKAKIISKKIRDDGPKGVQAQIQGDQLRVTAKKKDDLQAVIAMLKQEDFGIALQFTNYR